MRLLVIGGILGATLLAQPAEGGAPPIPTPALGCVQLQSGCISDSPPTESFCGAGSHMLAQPGLASRITFGAGIAQVILTQCDTGDTLPVTGTIDFCSLPSGWNDRVCALDILLDQPGAATGAPAAGSLGLAILVAALAFGGTLALRPRRRPSAS